MKKLKYWSILFIICNEKNVVFCMGVFVKSYLIGFLYFDENVCG